MCLIIKKNSKPIILTEDKVVYKKMDNNVYDGEIVYSFYYFYRYTLNKLYEGIELKTQPYFKTPSVLDSTDMNEIKKYLKDPFLAYHSYQAAHYKGLIRSIGEGYHSATTPSRLKKDSLFKFDREYSIYKCIVPAGSTVYYGVDKRLLVSDKIIIIEDITNHKTN